VISLPPHPKWGAACESYAYVRDDGMRCVQAKYRNGADSPKNCAWWIEGTDGLYYLSHGDVKLERLHPYNASLLSNPRSRGEPIILAEGPKDSDALVSLGFVSSDHRALVAAHVDWYRGRDIIIIADRDPASSATSGAGYRNHHPGKQTPGERAAAKAKRIIAPVARRLAVVTMPGAGVKDAAQWVALQTGTPAEKANILRGMFEHALACGDGAASASGPISAVELMEATFPEPRFIVDGLLPDGVAMLAGKSKMGKSWLAMQIAVAIASGRPALGQYPVDRGEVLYLALEDRQRRLQARMRAVLQGQPAPAGLYFETEWPRLNDGGADKLISWLDDHPAAKAVMIDVWVKVRAPTGNSKANIYEIDYAALEPLRRIVAERGILLLLLHHFRKGDADDPLDLISGSTGIAGSCDTLLILKRERGKAEAFLYVTGRDITDTEKATGIAFNATVENGERGESERSPPIVHRRRGSGVEKRVFTKTVHRVHRNRICQEKQAYGRSQSFTAPFTAVHYLPHRSPNGERGEQGERGEHGEHGERTHTRTRER
jgi:AAA domain